LRPRGPSESWVPAPEKEQKCGKHAKLSRLRVVDTHTHVCAESAQGHGPENW
jgi:hypothetical protein